MIYLVFRDGRTKNNTASKIVVDYTTTTSNVADADDIVVIVDGRHYQTAMIEIDDIMSYLVISLLVGALTRQLIAIFGSLT